MVGNWLTLVSQLYSEPKMYLDSYISTKQMLLVLKLICNGMLRITNG